jgi:hypothetical protein
VPAAKARGNVSEIERASPDGIIYKISIILVGTGVLDRPPTVNLIKLHVFGRSRTPVPTGFKLNLKIIRFGTLNYNLAVKRYFLSVGEGLAPPATNK